MKIEYKNYIINKTSKYYYCKILTDKGIITIKGKNIEEIKKKLDKYI